MLNKVARCFKGCFWDEADNPTNASEPHVIFRVPTTADCSLPNCLEAHEWVNMRPFVGANVLVAYFCADKAVAMEKVLVNLFTDLTPAIQVWTGGVKETQAILKLHYDHIIFVGSPTLCPLF